ncbi:MAG TPA: Holliday junction resolvase RecU [Bacillota bacterium]|nr:Holliday junction resolvase RecU [Bacillota bacterium]
MKGFGSHMTFNYPSGTRVNKQTVQTKTTRSKGYGNRGATLENDLNVTNKFYVDSNRANIHKKPTPIQIVDVHYPRRSAAVITEAYFKQPSTTDYNGVYKEKYIDFEAKETKQNTRFPLSNIHDHQIEHMSSILHHGGISFFIIRFTTLDETYFVNLPFVLSYWENQNKGGRKSIPYDHIKENGHLIPLKYQTPVDYLSIIDRLFF